MNNRQLQNGLKNALFFLILLRFLPLGARIEHTGPAESEPLPVGNFSLPSSQQPVPLDGFGQNIIDKHDLLLYFFSEQFKGNRVNNVEILPYILYGISNRLSVYAAFPYLTKNSVGNDCSVGIEDIFAQFEYAYFVKKQLKYAVQSTLVGAVYAPTGSTTKEPPTGFGSMSYFLGVTLSWQTLYWELFTAQGGWLTTNHNSTKFGNQFWYQFGLEKVIATPPGWLLAGAAELNGYYLQRDTIAGQTDPNSGSNTIFLIPSLWISSEHLIVQLGVGFPVFQSFNGDQPEFRYLLAGNVAIKVPF